MTDNIRKVVREMRDCAKTRPDTPLSGILTHWADRLESATTEEPASPTPAEVEGLVGKWRVWACRSDVPCAHWDLAADQLEAILTKKE